MSRGEEQCSDAIPPSQPPSPNSNQPPLIPYRSGVEEQRQRPTGFAIVRCILYCVFNRSFFINVSAVRSLLCASAFVFFFVCLEPFVVNQSPSNSMVSAISQTNPPRHLPNLD